MLRYKPSNHYEVGKEAKDSLFLPPRTFFLDLIRVPSVLTVPTFQVIPQLGSAAGHIFSSEWRCSCDVIRIKYIHVIFRTRQTVLPARLIFGQDWVLTVTTAFRQRNRVLRNTRTIKYSHERTWPYRQPVKGSSVPE